MFVNNLRKITLSFVVFHVDCYMTDYKRNNRFFLKFIIYVIKNSSFIGTLPAHFRPLDVSIAFILLTLKYEVDFILMIIEHPSSDFRK